MGFCNNLIKCVLILTSFILISAQKAPYIQEASGTFSNNNIITITGNAFGDKLQAQPIRYDDFEGLTIGRTIGEATGWWKDGIGGSSTLRISDEKQRTNFSSRNVISRLNDDRAAYKNNIGFAKTRKIYVNLWMRMNWGSGGNSYQLKLWRVSTFIKPGHASRYPDISFVGWKTGGYTKNYYINHYYAYRYTDPSKEAKLFWFPDNLRNIMSNEGWYNVALQVEQGDVGQSNGNIVSWISHLPRTKDYEKLSLENHMILDKIDDNIIDAILVGEKIVNGGTASTLYYDDIYIDNSWSRVEIGDAAEYDKCTFREIQIPQAWTDDKITISMRQGLFQKDTQAYLFVVNENGEVSNDLPIMISRDSNTPIPIRITTTSISSATIGIPYSHILKATGGQSPYTWEIVSGSLPNGIELRENTLSGITNGPEGNYNFTVQVTDNAGSTATQNLTLQIISGNFSPIQYFGNSANWEPDNSNYWTIAEKDSDKRYIINQGNLSRINNKLATYSLVKNRTYTNFTMTLKVKSPVDLQSNNADFAIVFGYQDDDNYYYIMFNSNAPWSAFHKVKNGSRTEIKSANAPLITDNEHHNIEVSRQGRQIVVKRDDQIVLTANDATFGEGRIGIIGIGTFNDAAYFDDIEIISIDATDNQPPVAPQNVRISKE